MIGVIADPTDQEVVREFFELFKTPWEFCRGDRRYEVLLCAGGGQPNATARLVLVYAGTRTCFDDEQKLQTGPSRSRAPLFWSPGCRIPVYGESITFPEKGRGVLADDDSGECVAYRDHSTDRVLVRVGYDLFSEIRHLLSVGQPPANADMPVLELHIAFLRDLITGSGIPLTEIPPVPEGYPFIACLTHDIDHPSVRLQKWDYTTIGFLYRAALGSFLNFLRGRLPVRGLLTNWMAALKLPFVHLGLAKDFWRDFDDRYLKLEGGSHSTFFVIPFKNRPGRDADARARSHRGASYGARDVADTMQNLLDAGCEVGLHGIDAWLDSGSGREELEEIRRLTGHSELGVRMHWLYWNQQSPAAIEKAGAAYDSTVGYNETVGYRAGTTQAYKPLEANRLLELPLHVMDTAMFYAAYLRLSTPQAEVLLRRMVDTVSRFGGCLTVNWHDRSLAPERLWGASYDGLLQDLKGRGAWFATAGQAVSWFQKRRRAVFETEGMEPNTVRAKLPAGYGSNLPGLRLRIHKAREREAFVAPGPDEYVDAPVDENVHSKGIILPESAR